MRLVDIHTHLNYPPLSEDVNGVIARAKEAGVKRIIANGTTPQANRKVLLYAKKYDEVRAALGFYPTHIPEFSQDDFLTELDFIKQQKKDIVALGEVGLDKKFAPEDIHTSLNPRVYKQSKEELFKKQVWGFEHIISLAEKTKLPVITHTRKAEQDVFDMFESSSLSPSQIILHCFTGKKRLVKQARDNGWNFSVPVSVIKLQQFQELVKETSLSQLFTETDAPFLGPVPGKPNEPANVSLSIQKIAELKKSTPEETADHIFMNYMKTFG
ncbi:MAG: TatD family hydrolase [Candidatus Nanoarchaeia archaeon]